MALSKREVDRAGEVLRAAASGADVGEAVLAAAIETAEQFRIGQALTLELSVRDLEVVSAGLSAPSEVGRRLKRLSTMEGKLIREPRLKLSSMRDIAGCRLVVPSLADLEQAHERLQNTMAGEVLKIIDYVAHPRVSGYRGLHVIGRYDGLLVEFQLRTQLMHRWAQISEAVQAIELRERPDLTDGDVAEWLREYSQVLAYRDRGETLSPELEARVRAVPDGVLYALIGEGRR